MALSPGPAGLKFWTPPGLAADNADDTGSLPASVSDQFNPWGRKRPVQDWTWGNLCLYPPSLATTFPADAGSYALTGSDLSLIPGDIANLPAGGANWFNPWGPKRPVQDWFRGPIPAVPVIFTAASGSYILTGTAAIWALGHAAGAGSYSITGSAATLALRHVAGAGSYTLTGSPAGFAITIVAAAGSYTATGSAVTFAFGQVGAAGSYTLTGANAALVIPGAVTYLPAGMSGGYVPWRRPFPVNLRTSTGRVLAPAPIVPADTNLPAGATNWFNPWGRPFPIGLRTSIGRTAEQGPVVLTAAAGSYVMTGSAAGLIATSTGEMPAGAVNWFNPWGRRFPVNLRTSTGRVLASAAPFTLTAAAGSYAITGASATLALGLTANSGSYTVSGTAAVLARGFAAGAGAYAITGTDAELRQAGSIALTCESGSYTLSGGAVSFLGITPPTVEQPGGSYVGRVSGASRGRMIRRLRKDEDLAPPPLGPVPPDLKPPALGPVPPDLKPPVPGLLVADLAPPPRTVLRSAPDTDEDEDEIALLLKLLS